MSRRRKSTNGGDVVPQPHSHSHSHSLFGGHSHSHGSDTAERILSGGADKGTRITVIGLFANIGLTAIKGAAGYLTHSSALIADAAHSLSDLLGDFVTLSCYRLSRRPPTATYPFGFSKFETLGTSAVAMFLVAGAGGLMLHSYHSLLHELVETTSTLSAGPLQEILANVTSVAPTLEHHGHSHSHGVDPNALWFAALGVVSKEWLFRATKSVAKEENSSVLLANAYHHRSDAYGSGVAFLAILGNWWWPALPLDPIGGFLVSIVILQQGGSLLYGVWGDLTDAGISPDTRTAINRALDPLMASSQLPTSSPSLLAIRHIRGRHSGSLIFVDLTAEVPANLTTRDLALLEEQISHTLKATRKEVAELRIKFQPVDNSL
ncbi:Cation efflux family [Mycena kentingensis (nom. inval.)]|nr:Cation efflux family [Mycena kentingensis (nom. inval.)]